MGPVAGDDGENDEDGNLGEELKQLKMMIQVKKG
jgi:hypothetical protein